MVALGKFVCGVQADFIDDTGEDIDSVDLVAGAADGE